MNLRRAQIFSRSGPKLFTMTSTIKEQIEKLVTDRGLGPLPQIVIDELVVTAEKKMESAITSVVTSDRIAATYKAKFTRKSKSQSPKSPKKSTATATA